MKTGIRPPLALTASMIADVLDMADVTSKKLDQAIRRRLTGTPYRFPKIQELVAAYRAAAKTRKNVALERLLRCKTVRTDSGVAPITLLTKPYACPGKCVYCPTEARMPKSYVASEPAAARALRLKFDPWRQVWERVQTLERNGHDAKKIELIIKGGTWSAYPWAYRQWFVKRCFDAANQLGHKKRKRYSTLAASQNANESAAYRIIGLTIETRPDWINSKEIARLRELGCTRVELGVQATDDAILALTKRGHGVAEIVRATALLKAAAFKTDYHFLPGQPGSNAEKDVAMFSELFDDPRFRPDMVKIYPCVVIPTAELHAWYKAGTFKPLEGEALIDAIAAMKARVPYYCRLSRVIRDFPAPEIAGGNLVSNLRDVIKERMKSRGLVCRCLRCREAGHVAAPSIGKPMLFVETYENAGGTEHFISLEDEKRTTVFAFLRLRLPDLAAPALLPELKGAAFVRELHTYGQALKIKGDLASAVQHKGAGKMLMREAERMARAAGYRAMAVISGVGVRGYYRTLGYRRVGTYMRKKL